ncbi:ABC transporter ATP-binding protein [Bosea psychrotolerans]|uniref:Capsular polysaccharide transport system ATP-binding protein n=1 Tax=Bosea psychrotolerans TaxID=1871628 RepID=A0A2S4MFA9_9HYPH|nr:capsular polysaccharide transport system ATP-binding protein [Bosea psychrotolerans]
MSVHINPEAAPSAGGLANLRGAGATGSARAVRADNVIKEFETEHGPRRVLDGISFSVGIGERMAVLGRNGAGKSTLIKILAGVEKPTHGSVHRGLNMSWPLGLGGGFEGQMTGYDTSRFIATLYGAPLKETVEYVADFTELGNQLFTQVRFYSDGMRARLAFALSLAIDFECYLIDEVILVGDRRFQQRCHDELFVKRKDRAMLMAIHSMEFAKEFCSSALVLKQGRGRVFYDLDLACAIYATL